jgi:type IV fimbrial biogenesis protein FimT
MVTLAVAAILLVVGVPSFREFIDSNRLSSGVNALIADLNMARSEAIKRTRTVTLCASADGASCATSGGWEHGRILFADNNANATVDNGEAVIRVSGPAGGSSRSATWVVTCSCARRCATVACQRLTYPSGHRTMAKA